MMSKMTIEAINKATDNRPEAFIELLEERAKEINPDYPYKGTTAFDWLWSISCAYSGTNAANQACHAFIKHLGRKLEMDDKTLYAEFTQFMEAKESQS